MHLIGHKIQWESLKSLASNNMVPQVMLFSGPKHLGKRKIAMEFAKLLNCDALDTYLIEPKQGKIDIEQIREMKKNLVLRPIKSDFKIGLIDNAECMNRNAQNCLLKTLEEPRDGVILILISSNPGTLADTLLSRMQILRFYPLKVSEIRELIKGDVSEKELELIMKFCDNKPGKAVMFLEEPKKLKKEIKYYKSCENILNSSLAEKFNFIKEFLGDEEQSQKFKLFLRILTKYLRTAMLEKIEAGENDGIEIIKNKIEAVEELNRLNFRYNFNLKLALENLFLNFI